MTRYQKGKPVNILLVEDNLGDIRLIQEVLKEITSCHKLYPVRDGKKAMLFLRKEGVYTYVDSPELIVLDLNLSSKNGRETLVEIKSDWKLKHIPVVVLSNPGKEEDVNQLYRLYANCFLFKSADYNQFTGVMKSTFDFWLSTVKLPPQESIRTFKSTPA
jgi:chemotaxis family two-component system response regulator Rcp1